MARNHLCETEYKIPADEGNRHGDGRIASNAPSRRVTRLTHAIESDIVPRLVLAHRSEPPPSPTGTAARGWLSEAQVEEFTQLLLARSADDAVSYVETLRSRGAPLAVLFLDLFAPAARSLGKMWEEDLCDFTEVTVGLWRLELASRELSHDVPYEVPRGSAAARALLSVMPGEQHTLGLTIVSEFFRRAGWEVASLTPSTRQDVTRAARGAWYSIIGLSVSTSEQVDRLPPFIASIRRASQNRSVTVMVGGAMFVGHPELVAHVGADVTARDAEEAVSQAQNLLDRPTHRSYTPRLV